nr:CPPV300 hypothetical protein [Cooks petrelpox virus]
MIPFNMNQFTLYFLSDYWLKIKSKIHWNVILLNYFTALGIIILIVVTPILIKISINDDECLDDWIKYENYCYRIVYKHKSWYDSKKHCCDIGGNLIMHPTKNFINMIKIQHFWTGINMVKQPISKFHALSLVNNKCRDIKIKVYNRYCMFYSKGVYYVSNCKIKKAFICTYRF